MADGGGLGRCRRARLSCDGAAIADSRAFRSNCARDLAHAASSATTTSTRWPSGGHRAMRGWWLRRKPATCCLSTTWPAARFSERCRAGHDAGPAAASQRHCDRRRPGVRRRTRQRTDCRCFGCLTAPRSARLRQATWCRPYGIALDRSGRSDASTCYVTDNDETLQGGITPPEVFGRRVHHYDVSVDGARARGPPRARLRRARGRRPPVRRRDHRRGRRAHDQVLVADETTRDVKVYTLDGRYTGRAVGGGPVPDAAGGHRACRMLEPWLLDR